jgi:hypothetical protein
MVIKNIDVFLANKPEEKVNLMRDRTWLAGNLE